MTAKGPFRKVEQGGYANRMMLTTLSAPHRRTYDSLFGHPAAHNLEWHAVRSMLAALGEAEEEPNGNTRYTCNGQSLVLRPEGSETYADEVALMKVRHFLKSSETNADATTAGHRFLVVIDHHEARIFKSEGSRTVPERIVPHDPHGFGKHVHNVHDSSKGQHHPVPKSYFAAVAKSLLGAQAILLFGSGAGGGSAMSELLDNLHKEHRDLFERVVGAQVVDETHLTEGQLLAKAREFYAAPHA